MKKILFIIFFSIALVIPVLAQDFFHYNATNSYSWTGDGFDYLYKETTVPLTDNDPTHTFTKLQHWHIPFAQMSSVDFANTGSASEITVAIMLKSEIAYQDTESSYLGAENDYTDHSIVCYVHFFRTWQDGKTFIDYIKRHLETPRQKIAQATQTQHPISNPQSNNSDDTSWSGKKFPVENTSGLNVTSVVLEGSDIRVYHYFYSQLQPPTPADPYDYENIALKDIISAEMSQNDAKEVVLHSSQPVSSYYYYAENESRGTFEKLTVSDYTVTLQTTADAEHFYQYVNHHISGNQNNNQNVQNAGNNNYVPPPPAPATPPPKPPPATLGRPVLDDLAGLLGAEKNSAAPLHNPSSVLDGGSGSSNAPGDNLSDLLK
jgi:hypothetical protein